MDGRPSATHTLTWMLAAFTFSPELLLAAIGVAAAGWGVSRSGAVAGWKSVAEARKERIGEIEDELARAQELIVALGKQIAELERRPDMTAVIDQYELLMGSLSELKEAVNEIAQRWG